VITEKETYLVPLQIESDHIPDIDSRIVGKLYVNVSGEGSAPTVRIYYQGATSSRWEIPANSEIFQNIYVPYENATKDIDLNERQITNVSTITFTDGTFMTSTSTFGGAGEETDPIFTSSAPVTYLFKNEKASNSDLLDSYDSSEFGLLNATQTWTGTNTFKNDIDLSGYRITGSSTIAYSTSTNAHDLINMEFFHKYRTQMKIIVGTTTKSTSSTEFVDLGLHFNYTNIIQGIRQYQLKINVVPTNDTTVEYELRKSTSPDFANEIILVKGSEYLRKTEKYNIFGIGFEYINEDDLDTTFYYRLLWKTETGIITSQSYDEDYARLLFIVLLPYQDGLQYEE